MRNLLFLILFPLFAVSGLQAQEPTVFKTDTGHKYHKTSCRYLKESKTEITLIKAIALSLEACKVCKPINTSIKTDSANKEASHLSINAQCSGKTKAGKRCKRKTKNASGKCYQHE